MELDGRQIYVREDRETEPAFNQNPTRPIPSSRPAPIPAAENAQVFVNNLPYSVGWQELKDLFFQAGSVVRADVQSNHQGRSKGCGTVLFASAEDAQNAIATLNGHELGGRNIEVREDRFPKRAYGGAPGGFATRGARPPRPQRFPAKQYPNAKPNPFTDGAYGNGEPSQTIYVSNLPWATTDSDLVDLFITVGQVERAEIQLEPSGRSAGAGVVKFDNAETAEVAISKFQGYEYGQRPLVLSFVTYPAPSATPTAPAAVAGAAPGSVPVAPASVVAAAAAAAPVPAPAAAAPVEPSA